MPEPVEYLEGADIERIMSALPHRYPFLLVDRLLEMRRGESAVGIKNVTMNEWFFQGHFPGRPVFPGVLIIEALAQTAAAFTVFTEGLDTDGKVVFFTTIDKVKFRRPVQPGDQLKLAVKVAQNRGMLWKYEGQALVEDAVAAEASFAAMVVEK
ncbi:MAG: 3-hydroxyacyl-ACP dehydratase FabZ [Pseudomonadota bacterium]